MGFRSDPTANRAVSSVQKEWIEMSVLAVRIRQSQDRRWVEQQKRLFTGIYKRLLTDPTEEILREIPEKVRRKIRLRETKEAASGQYGGWKPSDSG